MDMQVARRAAERLCLFVSTVTAFVFAGDADTPIGVAPIRCSSWPPYACERADIYGGYTVSVWRSLDEAAPSYYQVVTVDRDGIRLACQNGTVGLGSLGDGRRS